MIFSGKNRRQSEDPSQEKSLYPVRHVADSLKEYQKELVKKEVASLSELSLVGSTFSGVLKEADNFQEKLQELGQSFSSIDQTAGQFGQVRGGDRPDGVGGPGPAGGAEPDLHAGTAVL